MTQLRIQGESSEARYLTRAWNRQWNHLKSSHTQGRPEAVDELLGVWTESKEENWDGFNGMPVTKESLGQASRFIQAIPQSLGSPTIGADPDGTITLEWYRKKDQVLSVNVTGDGLLHFAALMGPRRHYGTELFLGEIPPPILNLIRQVLLP